MIKIGIVGAGLMGKTHAHAWKATLASVVGIHSLRPQKSEHLAQAVGTRAYDSLDALLAVVDVIDICVPTHLHHNLVLKAAQAGKHIVCEKPLARTVAEGAAMIAACKAAGVQLWVAHVVRFFPEYALAKAAVPRGAIGSVAVLRSTRVSSRPTWAEDNWLFDDDKSGSFVLDLMVHDFDYARWVAGDVESVFCKRHGDYALAILRHTNGAISNIEGGWVYPPGTFRTALEIAGSGGLIESPSGASAPLASYLRSEASQDARVPASPLLEDPYTTQIKHFYDLLTGKPVTPIVTAEEAFEALKIGLAAVESVRTGKSIRTSEVQS
jgi:predicted dehydrogenase